MTNHHQPTKAELQAGMAATIEKLKTIPKEEVPPTEPVTPPTTPTTPVTPPADPAVPPVVPPTEPVTPVVPPTEPVTPPTTPTTPVTPPADPATPTETDWEKKFKAASAEMQVKMFKEKELEKAEADAEALTEPTDEEMKALYPNFEELDKVTQELAKDKVLTKKKNEIIKVAKDKFKQIEDWSGKVQTFVEDPQTLIAHPELEGKVDDFKTFANKPTRRGVEFEDLILAFKGELSLTAPVHHEGGMFEQGSGGPAAPVTPKDDKLSIEEGAALKKTDYKKFLLLLKQGKIRTL